MATNSKGEGAPLGDMTPETGGKRGGLVFVLVVSVILLLVVAFLWANALQQSKKLQNQIDTKDSTIKDLTAQRDQFEKEALRLRAEPSEAQGEIQKLNEIIEDLTSEKEFAEIQREDASELLIECQREKLDLENTVAELETRMGTVEEGGK
jgi:chromosome segregation ATPase